MEEYRELLPDIPRDEMRRIRGEQDIIVLYEPARALDTLPLLLTKASDRARLRKFLDRLLADRRLAGFKPTPEQLSLLERVREIVAQPGPASLVSTRRSAIAEPEAIDGVMKN